MDLLAAMILCLGIALFGLLALLGDRQFANQERLPVYWGAGGSAKAYAPRGFALSVFPAVGLLTLAGLAWAGKPVFILTLLLLGFTGGNLIFFRAIARTLQEQ